VDEVLVAVGRSLDGGALGLDAAGIEWTPKGIRVDEHLRSSQPWAWAAGDVVGGALFTHVASELGRIAAANALLGAGEVVDLRIVPRVTFTDPEVASVGLTERQAREAGHEVRVGFARLAEAEKAQIDGQTHGHVKAVAAVIWPPWPSRCARSRAARRCRRSTGSRPPRPWSHATRDSRRSPRRG